MFYGRDFLNFFLLALLCQAFVRAGVENRGFLGGPFLGVSSDSSGSVVNQVGPIVDLVETVGMVARSEKSSLSNNESTSVDAFLRLDDGTMTELRETTVKWSEEHPELFLANGFAYTKEITKRARISISAVSGGFSTKLFLRLVPGQSIEEAVEEAQLPKVLANAVDLQVDGWKQSNWFGTFYTGEDNWIHHQHHGWMYTVPGNPGSVWLWSDKQNWLWTGPGIYPHLYRNKDASWLYFIIPALPRKVYYNQSVQTFEELVE